MVEEALTRTGALLSGHFRLSSGLHSSSYVQCARLLEQPKDAIALGEALAAKLRHLNVQRVVAPALGGVVIGFTVAQALGVPMIFTERKEGAMVLRRGFSIGDARRVVIVEDVVTTGKSTRETASVVQQHGGEVVGYGAILNRSDSENPFDLPFAFLERMRLEGWKADECPLCLAGQPVESPGSRFSA